MSLLKRENWFVSLILMIFTGDLFVFILAYMMDIFDKDAWYMKWQYWVIGALCLLFPVFILFTVFEIQMLTKIAKKLNVPGEEIYSSPYSWILCIIVPVIGWILLMVMYIYLNIWILVELYKGEGEKYIH